MSKSVRRKAPDPIPAPDRSPGPDCTLTSDPPAAARATKLDRLVALLQRAEGATIAEMQAETGWQAHSVRGALAGAVKKRLALPITSAKEARGRVYRVSSEAQA